MMDMVGSQDEHSSGEEDLARVSDRRGEELSFKDKVVSAALWSAGAAWMAPILGTMTALQRVMPADRIEWLSRLYCRGQIALTGSRWRTWVHPDVDPNAVYMFAQNHTNHFDHAVLYSATPHFKQGLELEAHFDLPVYGTFMRSRGTIAVPKTRGRRLEAIREGMRREIARGHSLLVFPEGTRTLNGRVGPFRTGVLRIARDLGVPVVPVAVTGMYDVMRKGSWVIRPGHTVTVHVEAPVPLAGLTDHQLAEATRHIRDAIASHVDEYFRKVRGTP